MTAAPPPGPAPATAPGGDEAYLAWKDWSREAFGAYSRVDGRYFGWHVRRAMGAAAAGRLRILEVGYGNGGFMGWAAQAGHEVIGVEQNLALVRRAEAAGHQARADLADLDPSARYDLVAAFDVLEHVPTPALVGFLDALKARLAPGGALLLRFPNGDSPFGRANQHGDLTHVSTIGTAMVEQLCVRCGLRVEALGEAPWYALHPGSPVKGLLRQVLRWVVGKLLKHLYLDRRVELDPNLVVVLRVAPPAAR